MLIHQICGNPVKMVCLEQQVGNLPGILICPFCRVSVTQSECNGVLDVTDQVYASNFNESIQVVNGDDHITIRDGYVFVQKPTAAAMTLDAPVSGGAALGGNDGVSIDFMLVTSQAHTVTTAPGKFMPGNKTTLTMVPPAASRIVAYNGQWYLKGPSGGSLS